MVTFYGLTVLLSTWLVGTPCALDEHGGLRRMSSTKEMDIGLQKPNMPRSIRQMDFVRETTYEKDANIAERSLQSFRSKRDTSTTSNTAYTRLLSVGYYMSNFVQFDLTDFSKSSFPLESPRVQDIVYDDVSGNIIWCNGSFNDLGPSGIYAVPLEGGAVVPLRTGFVPSGLAIDKGRQLLFSVIMRPQRSIVVMSLDGSNYSVLHEINYMGWHPYSLALDTAREVIYWCQEFRFVRMDYSGNNVQTIMRGAWIHAVTLDPIGGVLYFNDDKKLMKMVLETQEITQERRLNVIAWKMVYHDQNIYIGLWESGGLMVFNTTRHRLRRIGMLSSNYVNICLIP